MNREYLSLPSEAYQIVSIHVLCLRSQFRLVLYALEAQDVDVICLFVRCGQRMEEWEESGGRNMVSHLWKLD